MTGILVPFKSFLRLGAGTRAQLVITAATMNWPPGGLMQVHSSRRQISIRERPEERNDVVDLCSVQSGSSVRERLERRIGIDVGLVG